MGRWRRLRPRSAGSGAAAASPPHQPTALLSTLGPEPIERPSCGGGGLRGLSPALAVPLFAPLSASGLGAGTVGGPVHCPAQSLRSSLRRRASSSFALSTRSELSREKRDEGRGGESGPAHSQRLRPSSLCSSHITASPPALGSAQLACTPSDPASPLRTHRSSMEYSGRPRACVGSRPSHASYPFPSTSISPHPESQLDSLALTRPHLKPRSRADRPSSASAPVTAMPSNAPRTLSALPAPAYSSAR